MTPKGLPPSPLGGLRVIELGAEDVPALQRFLVTNPEYSIAVSGAVPGPNEAHEVIHGAPPKEWTYSRHWVLGFVDAGGALVAMADVVSDLLAPGVWQIGLFIVAATRHGTGDAQALYRGLEAWAASNRARWMRLGVVRGNARAERFWKRLGFAQVRTRGAAEFGDRTNTVRVMVKSLDGSAIEHYLSLVPRDRPESSPSLQERS